MPSELGAIIRGTRQKAGLGLRELARRVEKSPAYLVLLERSETPPGVTEATLRSIGEQLDLNVDLLMTLASKISLSLTPRTPLEVELYRLIMRLPAARQESLRETLQQELGPELAQAMYVEESADD